MTFTSYDVKVSGLAWAGYKASTEYKPGNADHNLNRIDIGGNRFCSACGQVEIVGQKGQVFMLTPECPTPSAVLGSYEKAVL